ncbi:MAG TPA: T9SS type A sorting domain-containing protein [Chitinispirillaceae bacterium]|nr:T9SS type A sorting domain-containing protein [Chitinispirillaceae bacterium]
MGKKVLKASGWTIRSVLLLINKAVTLVFALFCVGSGLFARTVSEGQKNLKGVAYSGADSTVLANIKLYLCSVIAPVYGVGSTLQYTPVDSTVTDSNGNFIFENCEQLYSITKVLKIDSVSQTDRFRYVSGADVNFDKINDTLKLYLKPLISTDIKTAKKPETVPIIKSTQGRQVSIKIGNWSGKSRYNAKILNASGKLVYAPSISSDGLIVWNTEKVARGTYFLNITTGNSGINSKIILK